MADARTPLAAVHVEGLPALLPAAQAQLSKDLTAREALVGNYLR
jgi:hypothetical protein